MEIPWDEKLLEMRRLKRVEELAKAALTGLLANGYDFHFVAQKAVEIARQMVDELDRR